MKIQIASDLHLPNVSNSEWMRRNPLQVSGDVLVLAGDVENRHFPEGSQDFDEFTKKNFRKVISIPGNHDYYHREILEQDLSYLTEDGNKVRLNNRVFVFEEVRFLGTTLWSYIPEERAKEFESELNDLRYIKYKGRNLEISDINEFNKRSIEFLIEELNVKFEGKTVVISHHAPSFELLKESEREDYSRACELSELIKSHPEVPLWIYGHTHEQKDEVIGKTRVVQNSLGYLYEPFPARVDFNKSFTIEV
jgi:predicted phosphodiesterase